MQAIEFEAIPHQYSIYLPKHIPDGVKLRVLILMEDVVEFEAPTGGKKSTVHLRNCSDRSR